MPQATCESMTRQALCLFGYAPFRRPGIGIGYLPGARETPYPPRCLRPRHGGDTGVRDTRLVWKR